MILVSNDFPPKVGGIQNYLYELWSRLPLSDTCVITTKYKGDYNFDEQQSFEIQRHSRILWPTPRLVSHVNDAVRERQAQMVLIDPLLPTGLVSSRIECEAKAMIIHGAEVTVPGRILPTRQMIRRSMKDIDVVISAGRYAARELVRALDRPINMVCIPPGVDIDTFSYPSEDQRHSAREWLCSKIGVSSDTRIVMSASRIVPRKGFDVAITALRDLEDDIHLVIVGTGRDVKRLRGIAEKNNVAHRVHFLGRISLEDLVKTYHAADVFTMLCRDRWGSLEAEGFGIVFLEAQSCGVPVVAGRSGGSPEALIHGETGLIVDPHSLSEVRESIEQLLAHDARATYGVRGRTFVEKNHSYDILAAQLLPVVCGDISSARSFDG